MNAEEKSTVVEITPAPLLLEVHTERLLHLMGALIGEGFVIKHVRGRVNRFRIEDKVNERRHRS
jgi:hypothetical protein